MKPETNTSNIVARLQTYVESVSKPDDFAAAGLRKEIKDLISADPAKGYMVKGIYYCILQDHNKSLANHEKSLKLSRDSLVYTNYLTSLGAFGEVSKAYDLAVEAVNSHPGDIALVDYVARICFEAGKLEEVMEYYDIYKKLTVNQDDNEHESLTEAVSSAKQLLEKGIDIDEITKVIKTSESILLDNNVLPIATTLFVHEGEFSYILRTNASAEIAARLNNDLCNRLAALKDFIAYNFTLVFTPAAAE